MVLLEAHELSKYYTSEPILQDLSFRVMQGEKVGLVGENGCGKSTLLKMIAGLEAPTRGVLTRPGNPTVGYLAQELEYTPGNTVHQELLEVFAPLRALGGRLEELQHTLATPDLEAGQQERVEEALESFEGTVLVISHDRYFLDRIVTRIVEVDQLTLVDHPGNFSEYWRRRSAVAAPPPMQKMPAPRPRPPRPPKATVPPPKLAAQEALSVRIEALEAEQQALEKELAEAYATGDRQRGTECGYRLRALAAEIAAQYAAWEEVLS